MPTTGRVTQVTGRTAIQADADVAKGRVTQVAGRTAIQADADVAKGRVTQVTGRVALGLIPQIILSASPVSSSQIALSWEEFHPAEEGFRIERALAEEGPWVEIDTVGSNVTSYSDGNCLASTTYYYRVCAYVGVNNSRYSNIASATTEEAVVPAITGGDSAVGFVRETTWATIPTTGADPDKTISGITFFACKHEQFAGDTEADPQHEEMTGSADLHTVITNHKPVGGTLRFVPGPTTMGHLLTMMFGPPETTDLGGGAYQHEFRPNRTADNPWPVPYSIESQYGRRRSKLIQGAVITRLPIYMDNNSAVIALPAFTAKRITWLYPNTNDTYGSGTTDTLGSVRPAVMSEVGLLDEPFWHWCQLEAYPQFNGADVQEITQLFIAPKIPVRGIFTGGSGVFAGSYGLGNFQFTGRNTMLFTGDWVWGKFKSGTPFKIQLAFVGREISGGVYERLDFTIYSCYAHNLHLANRRTDLIYDFQWQSRRDPVEGKTCDVTLVNTVASYE